MLYFFKAKKIRERISEGELIPQEIVMKYVESNITDNMDKDGIILDGFPRDMAQVTEFETKVKLSQCWFLVIFTLILIYVYIVNLFNKPGYIYIYIYY